MRSVREIASELDDDDDGELVDRQQAEKGRHISDE
jgi:hypothetical protein